MELFFTPDIANGIATLGEPESKHCIRVLRHKRSDLIQLIDGKGSVYTARITDPNPFHCQAEITQKTLLPATRRYRLHIAMAPTKNTDRFEWFIEKAVEIGIDEITPLICDHSERKSLNPDRLDKVVVAAMKQSLQPYKPVINKMTTFEMFLAQPFDGERFLAFCSNEPKNHLGKVVGLQARSTILIGPEGDFSSQEIDRALEKGWTGVSLGESRLRTETAGVVACSIVNMMNELQ
ncbi:MAG TPA: 16S rRNA (uracil(1498)-N(3))-methyltransferase [Prolixibacteraceae bacterium]|nr:16S rRNA (uracil(1498)-N(3))-methyltransferase [Prolixibacteraceae bacterium]